MNEDVRDVALAILAKAPEPGLAKTRLAPMLGPEGAAAFQAKMLRQTVTTACAASVGPVRLSPVTLWCSPGADHPAFQQLQDEFPLALAVQPNVDLGSRMLAACHQSSGAATLVIGTDCPVLTTEHLQQAARCLRYGRDAVLIPAEDGGYVLIGLRHPDPRVFEGIVWGTESVLAATRRNLAAMGWHWNELQSLWDVDRPEDLARLRRAHPELAI